MSFKGYLPGNVQRNEYAVGQPFTLANFSQKIAFAYTIRYVLNEIRNSNLKFFFVMLDIVY